MYYIEEEDNRDHFEDHLATGADSLREFAHNAGMDNPDRCWLLDPRDVWVRNPFYSGPDVRHPEDDSDLYEDRDPAPVADPVPAPVPVVEDDIPF